MSVIADIEKGFNVTGSIPVVGIASGGVRSTLGGAQSTIGSIVTAVGLIGEGISPGSRQWIDLRKTGQEHALHGSLNVVRGGAEAGFAALALGGNLLALASANSNTQLPPGVVFAMAAFSLLPLSIQLISKNGFAPRIQYDLPNRAAEKAQPNLAKA